MTKIEMCTIISKVFAIFYFFKSANVFTVNIIPLFFQPEYTGKGYIIVWGLSGLFFLMALSAVFWFSANKLGKLIAGKDGSKIISPFSSEQFMAGVFVAFGCFLLMLCNSRFRNFISYSI